MEIYDGKRTKVVHTNRLQYRYVPGQHDAVPVTTDSENDHLEWTPPSVDHVILPPTELSNRYPQRQGRPPARYRP